MAVGGSRGAGPSGSELSRATPPDLWKKEKKKATRREHGKKEQIST